MCGGGGGLFGGIMKLVSPILGAVAGGQQESQAQAQAAPAAAPAATAPAAAVKMKSKSLLSAQGAGDTSSANTASGTAYGKTTLGS